MATTTYLVYDPADRSLCISAAGHPYPLLVRSGHEPEFLREGRSALLGAGIAQTREQGTVTLPPGSTLVLYTDGLIERRNQRSLDPGFAMLADSVRASLPDPDTACEAILDALLGEEPPNDDVALLVMRTSDEAA
jgi:serine phosphatase RsbU (regulator of sigma subunit)